MRVIGLCGAARCGKDTAADSLIRRGWKKMAFADPVRWGLLGVNPTVNVAALLHPLQRLTGARIHYSLQQAVDRWGWDALKEKTEVRGLLQRYGTEGGRDIHGQGCWLNIANRRLADVPPWNNVVFTDVRFPNESALIRKNYAGKVIRIVSQRSANFRCDAEGNHASEHSLQPSDWDAVVRNDSTIEDLESAITFAIRDLFGTHNAKEQG
jgi:hypothetical protein